MTNEQDQFIKDRSIEKILKSIEISADRKLKLKLIWTPRILDMSLPWKYEGTVHEIPTTEGATETKYKGFDPASVESYIMFEFMQDKYIDKSIDLASTIQKQFSNFARRSDRGVRQAGFWVLHRSACPSVLVELGFISNPTEERFLSSESGQKDMATSLYNAFVNFKRDHDKKIRKTN